MELGGILLGRTQEMEGKRNDEVLSSVMDGWMAGWMAGK